MLDLLTTFTGRIGRKQFWSGFLIVFVISIVLGSAIGLLGGGSSTLGFVLQILGSLLVLVCFSAIVVKRLHDRDRPTFPWAVILLAPGLVAGLMRTLGIGYVETRMGDLTILLPTASGYLSSLVAVVAGTWILIDLGLLKGSESNNSYGPNPAPKIKPLRVEA